MDYKDRILFIINPKSGIGKQRKVEDAIEKYLDKERFEYEINYTKYAHHATALTLAGVLKGFDTVVAVGGDGSINNCVKGLVSTGVTLGIIPAGSGNGLARCLKIPLSIEEAIKVINKGRRLEVDTIKVNDTVYASIAGIGFDALIAEEFSKTQTRGFQPYFNLVLQHYPFYQPKEYLLEIDGKEIRTNALFISFANSKQFGFNTEIAPKAELDDGLIDVVIVKKPPLPMVPWTAQLLFFKNFDRSMYVTSYQTNKVRVRNKGTIGANIDGEYVIFQDDLEFSIIPHSLNIIIP